MADYYFLSGLRRNSFKEILVCMPADFSEQSAGTGCLVDASVGDPPEGALVTDDAPGKDLPRQG